MSVKTNIGAQVQGIITDIAQQYQKITDVISRYNDAGGSGAFVDADFSSLPNAPTAAQFVNAMNFLNQLNAMLTTGGTIPVGPYKPSLDGFRAD